MKRFRWLSTAVWWLLPTIYALGLLGCAEAHKPATAAAWQPFVVRGVLVAKSYEPPHPEPRVVAGQVTVTTVPARWAFVVATPYGALTFTAGPVVYFAFAEHDAVLVRGSVSADGKQCRVEAIARPGATQPHGFGRSV